MARVSQKSQSTISDVLSFGCQKHTSNLPQNVKMERPRQREAETGNMMRAWSECGGRENYKNQSEKDDMEIDE